MSESVEAIKRRPRVKWSAQERAEWLALFKGSGQTAAEFCRGNDLSPATLSMWLRPKSSEEVAAPPEGELVEISLAGLRVPAAVPAVIVHLAGGTRLEIGRDADAAWVAELIRAMTPEEA